MSLGPVEILCIQFPSNAISNEITQALQALVDQNMIRIIDILFIRKSDRGDISITEIDELTEVDHSLLDRAIGDISGLIAEADVSAIAAGLDNGAFAALMLFENTWAAALQTAILKANGALLLNERIPSSLVAEALTAQQSAETRPS